MPSMTVERHVADLVARKPLLQMTADELIETYMSPLTLGVYLSFFLYGLFTLSLFMYFVKFRRDTWLNRLLVILLACFTTADTIAGGIRIFRITVLHPNNLAYLLDVTQRPEDWLCTVFLLCTILLCQLFLCFRILSFARRMTDWAGPRAKVKMACMAGALGLCWLACLGVSVANCVVFYKTTNYMELLLPTTTLAQTFRKTSLLMPCVLCAMDVMIAIVMSVQYRKAKTGFGDSNRMLEVLITVVVRNGVLVAVVMVVQFVVTFAQVLWGNFLPLSYGKLHALTVLCILTEPRLAHTKWHKDEEQRQAQALDDPTGPVETPYMDYTRPSQLASTGLTSEIEGQRFRRSRRYSTSSLEAYGRRQSDLLPFDGDGYEYSDERRDAERIPALRPRLDSRVSSSTSSGRSRDRRPGWMSRKISEAPTASSGNTALNPGTPIYELEKEEAALGSGGVEGQDGAGLVVSVEKEGQAGYFVEAETEKQGKDEEEAGGKKER